MPPQTDQPIAGSDVLLDTLRRSRLSDDERQQIWDAYHTQGDEKAFVGALNKLTLNDDVKQTLYDMRYRGFKNLPTNTPAQTVAALDTQKPAKGEVRPAEPTLQKAYTAGKEILGAAKEWAVDPFLQPYKEGYKDPFGYATALIDEFGSGLKDMYQRQAEKLTEAVNQPDASWRTWEGIKYNIKSGAEAAKQAGYLAFPIPGVGPGLSAVEEEAGRGETTQAIGHGLALALPEEAARLARGRVTGVIDRPQTSTHMGPIDSSKQALHIEVPARAPVEATAPKTPSSISADPLIAPKPFDFKDKEAPIRPYDPFGTRFAKGGTVGMEPIDIPAPSGVSKDMATTTPAYTPSEKVSTLSEPRRDLGPEFNAAQIAYEIDRNKQILRDPNATEFDKQVAQSRLQEGIVPEPKIPATEEGPKGVEAPKPTPSELKSVQHSLGVALGRQLGIDFRGIQEGVPGKLENHLTFQDPRSGSSLMVPVSEATEEGVRSRLEPMRQAVSERPPAPLPSPAKGYKPKSFDIPGQLRKNFDDMAELSGQADLAESDALRDDILKRREMLAAQSRAILKTHVSSLTGEQLLQLRDATKTEADRLSAQAKAIRDLTEATIKNRGVKEEIADLRSTGGPARELVVDPKTGERAVMKPEAQVARGARTLFDELQGRVPTSQAEDLQIAAKPEGVSDQEWAEHVGKLQTERAALKKQISDTVTIASETGSSLADHDIEGLVDRLKEIEGLLGKYKTEAGPGRRPNLPAELDEHGAIKAPEVIKSWSKERARAALGMKVRDIPTDEEFFRHADLRDEKARLLRTVSDVAQKALDMRNLRAKGERGSIGEVPLGLKGEVKIVSLKDQVPSGSEMLKEAKRLKMDGWEVTDDRPAGTNGWMSPDGKTWIDKTFGTHQQTAAALLPDIERGGSATRAMLEAGWIRRDGLRDFEIWNPTSKTFDAIEMASLRDGFFGQPLTIDFKSSGGIRSIDIDRGWESLESAFNEAKSRQLRGQAGKVGGVQLLGGAAAGGFTGMAVGFHFGGMPGAYLGGAIGFATGFMTPAVAHTPFFLRTFKTLGPGLSRFGVGMHEWMFGPKQESSVLRDMEGVRNAQQNDVRGPVRSFIQRLAQLPGDALRGQDDFYFINDRTSAMGKFLMQFDPRGEAFRDLRGKLSVDDSPYVAAWLAAGGGNGMQEVHLLGLKSIYQDGQKAGLIEHVEDYLNLKGYQRVYDVLGERIHEHDGQIKQLQTALLQPNIHYRLRDRLLDQIKDLQKNRQALVDRITSGDAAPSPYTPAKISQDLQNLQAQLGSKFQNVQGLANRVFDQNRQILDMIHREGIITDDAYNKYVARGNEYIPMNRIMEDMAENNGRIYGKTSPYYLRQQNVVKALSGSDRINRNPFVASADANLEAIREVTRNNVMKKMVRLGASDPQGVGLYFKRVTSGYKPTVDESLVGIYDGGQQHTFAVPSWLGETMKGASPVVNNVLLKPLQYFSQLLRMGATQANVAWSLPNALRHFGDMALMSDAGLKDMKTLPKDAAGLLRDWGRSVVSTLKEDPVWQEYMRSGAASGVLQRMITPEEHLNLDALGFKQKLAKGRIIQLEADFNKSVEDMTKLTTFRRLREAGLTETAAAWETRRYGGGPDFAKQGNMTRSVGLLSMFFNAHLQYVSRAFTRAKEQPGRIAVALGAITALAMTLNQHNFEQKDEKGNSLMRKVSFADRENNFVILMGGTYQSPSGATLPNKVMIPKPSFLKFLYNPIENMLNKIAGNEDRTGTQLGLRAVSNLLPGQFDIQQEALAKSAGAGLVSSLNPIVRVPIEEATNYTMASGGRPIVPARETGIESQFQYGPTTSPVFKEMGKSGLPGAVAGAGVGASLGYLIAGTKGAAIGGGLGGVVGSIGVSPRRMEHITYGTTSGVGQVATGFVDPFFGGVQQTRMEGPDKLGQTPIAGPIMHRFLGSSMDQEEQTLSEQFYNYAAKAKEPMATLKFLEKNHPELVAQYISAHKQELWKGQVATTMEQRLSQVGSIQRTIEQNQGMSNEDKNRALKNLHDAKLNMLKIFRGVIKPAPSTAPTIPAEGQGAPYAAGKQ